MTKATPVLLVVAALSWAIGPIDSSASGGEETPPPAATALGPKDREALELGRKVIKVRAALEKPEKKQSLDNIRSLGLDSRYYVMVRGWITQHISMTESYRGTSTYRESAERRKQVEDRVIALRKALRAIDLE
ncbi:MAG: hypothetical protein OER86_12400 [Phycisphaerae bacterium]|nr:hypothetical protein [Phycisphaerae bacterium]